MSRYPLVERPLTINGCTLRNRIVRAAHGTLLAMPNGFVIGDELIAYHVRRARSGVAMSIVETANVHPSSFGAIQAFLPGNDEGWFRLSEACHAEGMKVFQQLYHGGSTRGMMGDGKGAWSPSGGPVPAHNELTVPMTRGMIDEAITAFAEVGRRCKAAGMDGVEVHGAHGYLLHDFLSPLTNRRSDDYGGSFENRMRFMLEVLRALRAAVGSDYPIGIRLSADEIAPGGLAPADMIRVADRLQDEKLVDFLDLSLGTYFSPHMQVAAMHEPTGYELPWVEPVARSARVPVLVNGRFNTLADAEALLASGAAAMVSMVRALIADPDLIPKSLDGREAEIRPCIGCNQDCIGGVNRMPPRMGCVVNPEAGWELTATPPAPAEKPGRVIVVGGGPSGMEAARTARLRGHRVELHDAREALGGNMRFARRAPFRADIGKIVDYQARELERLGVDVRLGSTIGAEAARGADHVVVATGAEPRRDGRQRFWLLPVEGADLPHVKAPIEVLAGEAEGIAHALIYDDLASYMAVSVAEHLLVRGVAVTFASSGDALAEKLGPAFAQAPTIQRLDGYERFRFLARHSVIDIQPGTAWLVENGTALEKNVAADLVVFCTVGEPRTGLHEALVAAGIDSRLVGDAAGVIDLGHAIRSGRAAGMAL
jgi:2,4-dienoyl-CoA reductase-like NADH-dependent reductase (Old Yellow Enzyme family)